MQALNYQLRRIRFELPRSLPSMIDLVSFQNGSAFVSPHPIPPHKRPSDYGVPPRYLLRGPTIWTVLSITMQCKSLIAALLACERFSGCCWFPIADPFFLSEHCVCICSTCTRPPWWNRCRCRGTQSFLVIFEVLFWFAVSIRNEPVVGLELPPAIDSSIGIPSRYAFWLSYSGRRWDSWSSLDWSIAIYYQSWSFPLARYEIPPASRIVRMPPRSPKQLLRTYHT